MFSLSFLCGLEVTLSGDGDRFLLEWLSFTHRYVPMGIIEQDKVPQRINQKPPLYRGRGDLETLLSSPHVDDWIEISRILLGPLPEVRENSFYDDVWLTASSTLLRDALCRDFNSRPSTGAMRMLLLSVRV